MDEYKKGEKSDNLFKVAINTDELEYVYCGDMLFYKEIPFTGLGYELYSDGKLRELALYKFGFANGVCREWYPTGQLKSESELEEGISNGLETCWYENGNIKYITHYELGIQLDYQEWDENGNLIKSKKLKFEDSNPKYRQLLELREKANSKKKDAFK